MRIYWLNGGVRLEPESKEEWRALSIITRSLETIALCDGGLYPTYPLPEKLPKDRPLHTVINPDVPKMSTKKK